MAIGHGAAAVRTEGLTKRYRASVVVDRLNLTIRHGEVYGLLGAKGAGKTTILRMLLGLVRPSAGHAMVLGAPPGDRCRLQDVGALIEGPTFYPYLSGRDNLRVIAGIGGLPRRTVPPVLERLGLADAAGVKYGAYSPGMRQRLGVAAALLKDPAMLILDEPFNGLDPAGRRQIAQLIQSFADEGRTVVFAGGPLDDVHAVCDRVGVLSFGRLVDERDGGDDA